MSRILKWLGIIFGGIAAVIVVASAIIYLLSEQRLNETFAVRVEALNFDRSQDIIDEGEHLAVIRGCTDCHGEDLGGRVMISDPMIGTIPASNLTASNTGVGSRYSDAELARAIRHGVNNQDRGLLIMPSEEFFVLSDSDVSALIAYMRSLPPVDRSLPDRQLTLMARGLFMAGQLPPLAAEVIDHDSPHPEAPEPAADAEYGQYLATGCIGCHGVDYSGGSVPGGPPDAPQSTNLTPAGPLNEWTEAEFMTTLRSGITPDGRELNREYMPWPSMAEMSDVELRAIWAFLQSLPPVETS